MLQERVRGREDVGRCANENRSGQQRVLLAGHSSLALTALRMFEDRQEARERRAELRGSFLARVVARGNGGEEAFKNWQRLGHDGSLAGGRGEDGGEDVDDAGVQVGFDDGGEYRRSIDECGEGESEQCHRFVVEGVPDS